MDAASDTTRFWDPAKMQQPLSPDECRLRDLFCYEYLKDQDSLNAALRAGVLPSVAREYHHHILHDNYVQQKLDAMRRELPANPTAQLTHDQHRIETLLWELALDKSEKSSHSARVTATITLAKIKKLLGNEDEDSAMSKMEALAEMFRKFANTAPV